MTHVNLTNSEPLRAAAPSDIQTANISTDLTVTRRAAAAISYAILQCLNALRHSQQIWQVISCQDPQAVKSS